MPPPYNEAQKKDRKKAFDKLTHIHATHIHALEKAVLDLHHVLHDWTFTEVPDDLKGKVDPALSALREQCGELKKLNVLLDAPIKKALEALK